jgi:cold shock CspA family protein/arsenate reductase-like glutaredoxin family protein
MPNGTVKFFNAAKGFGFITPDEKGKEIFLPAASVTSAGIAELKAGQRVSFEALPDTKGPKAVDLKVIADAQPHKVQKSPQASHPNAHRKAQLTIYLDSEDEAGIEALAELRHAGFEPVVVDYIAAPPSKEELKRLSLLLRDNNQSLARKYEPLFLELRLDDRFISDSEFWGAIFEHPALINGPILATATRAAICRTEAAVEAFLAAISSGESPGITKPKGLPERLLRLIGGDPVLPIHAKQDVAETVPQVAVGTEQKTATAAPAKKASATVAAKPKSKPKAAPVAKPKPKSATKVKTPAKKSAVKKPGRAAKK